MLGTACSSSPSGGGCSITSSSTPTFASVTQAPGSDASCPAIAAADLNAPTGDGGSSCQPLSKGTCEASFTCPEPGGATVSGTISVSGSMFSGEFSVMVPTGSGTVTCNYNFTGTVSG